MQKISDLEERVHYLEDQNLTVRKALETALNKNKYLEDRLENLGTRVVDIENRAKVGKSFKEDVLELLELNENFELRITVLETKQQENLVELRSIKEREAEGLRKHPGSDLKVTKLLELVKQYDEAREKQVSKQNRKIEACEAKLETFLKNNPPSPSSSLDASSPSFNPSVKTPPSSSVFQGNPLHYALPTFAMTSPKPGPGNIPTGSLTEQTAALQMSLSEQMAAVQLSQLSLSQYHSFPLPIGFPYSGKPMFSTTTTEEKEDFETLSIDETQYCALVGTGGKKIDSIRDKTQSNITIKAKKDKPPHMYYEVQIKGTKQRVDEAKTLVMNAIYISQR